MRDRGLECIKLGLGVVFLFAHLFHYARDLGVDLGFLVLNAYQDFTNFFILFLLLCDFVVQRLHDISICGLLLHIVVFAFAYRIFNCL